jgi:hypothetical protein
MPVSERRPVTSRSFGGGCVAAMPSATRMPAPPLNVRPPYRPPSRSPFRPPGRGPVFP